MKMKIKSGMNESNHEDEREGVKPGTSMKSEMKIRIKRIRKKTKK